MRARLASGLLDRREDRLPPGIVVGMHRQDVPGPAAGCEQSLCQVALLRSGKPPGVQQEEDLRPAQTVKGVVG